MAKEEILTPWGEDARDCARTPQYIFDAAAEDCGPFELDAAADPASAKASLYLTAQSDGLKHDWNGYVCGCGTRLYEMRDYLPTKPGEFSAQNRDAGRLRLLVSRLSTGGGPPKNGRETGGSDSERAGEGDTEEIRQVCTWTGERQALQRGGKFEGSGASVVSPSGLADGGLASLFGEVGAQVCLLRSERSEAGAGPLHSSKFGGVSRLSDLEHCSILPGMQSAQEQKAPTELVRPRTVCVHCGEALRIKPLSTWLNCPYSNIAPWVEKASTAQRAALLLPVRSDRPWFRDLIRTANFLDFYLGRIQFEPFPGVKFTSNREYSVLAIFDQSIFLTGICRVRDAKTGRLVVR